METHVDFDVRIVLTCTGTENQIRCDQNHNVYSVLVVFFFFFFLYLHEYKKINEVLLSTEKVDARCYRIRAYSDGAVCRYLV